MFRKILFFLIILIVGLLSGQAWGQELSPYGNPLTRLTVKDVTVVAEVVSTPQKRYLGLSHRRELPEGQGMLFLFRAPRRRVFCMRDMHFPIDIIWIAKGKVAGLHKQLSPSNRGNLISPVPVSLVLEVPAGFADRHGIKKGDPVVVQQGGL